MIRQGDLYWLQPDKPSEGEADILHPQVVIQDDTTTDTVVVCALTTHLQRVSLPGNVLLEAGEGNLPRQSVVEVGKVSTLDKARLGDYIGTLSAERVAQILAGMRFLAWL